MFADEAANEFVFGVVVGEAADGRGGPGDFDEFGDLEDGSAGFGVGVLVGPGLCFQDDAALAIGELGVEGIDARLEVGGFGDEGAEFGVGHTFLISILRRLKWSRRNWPTSWRLAKTWTELGSQVTAEWASGPSMKPLATGVMESGGDKVEMPKVLGLPITMAIRWIIGAGGRPIKRGADGCTVG
jgi:hypothetical protein